MTSFPFFWLYHNKIAVKSLQFWQSILLSLNELGLMSYCKQKNRGCQSSGQGHHDKILSGKTATVAATSPACHRWVQFCKIHTRRGPAGLVSRGVPVIVLFLHNDVAQNKMYTWHKQFRMIWICRYLIKLIYITWLHNCINIYLTFFQRPFISNLLHIILHYGISIFFQMKLIPQIRRKIFLNVFKSQSFFPIWIPTFLIY